MIKVLLPLQAFPLGLIELHRSLSSIGLSATLPTAAFLRLPTEIRAACNVLTHLNGACNYTSSVAPGGGRRRRTEATDHRP